MSEPFQWSCHEEAETWCHFSLALHVAVELWLMDSISHVLCETFAAMPHIVSLGLGGLSGPADLSDTGPWCDLERSKSDGPFENADRWSIYPC